jgi:hypothetical protein
MNVLLQLMHDTMGKTARINGCVSLLESDLDFGITYNNKKMLEIIKISAKELNNVLDAYYIECKEDNHKNIKTPEEIKNLANKWALENADETMETNSALNKGFIGGYTKWQQDNTEKKYTIKEVEKYHDIRATQGISNANKYIESLNK